MKISLMMLLFTLLFCQAKAELNDFEINQQPISTVNDNTDTLKMLKKVVDEQFAGYSMLSYHTGDITNNKVKDIVLVMERACREDEDSAGEESRCRTAALLLNTGKLTFKVASVNDKLIGCSYCGGAGTGDPLSGITIKRGYVSFENLYGGCYKTFRVITFKYDKNKKDWFLHKRGTQDYNCKDDKNEEEVKVETYISTKKDFGWIRFSDY